MMNIRNIRNTMCRLSDLTNEQICSLVEGMPDSDCFDFEFNEAHIGITRKGNWGTWAVCGDPSIVTYTEMMQLLGKKHMKEFTKSDLKTGMFVKQRGGEFKLVLDDVISGGNSWGALSNYDDDMLKKSRVFAGLDIVAVYERIIGGCLSDYLGGQRLKIIWERTEQTEAQKEMEVLQEQAKALQEQITKLQGKL